MKLMLKLYRIIKIFIYFLILSTNNGQDKLSAEQIFVQNYLMNHIGKMNSSPLVWQDVKKGHLRFKAINYGEQLLDSLDLGYSPMAIVFNHFNNLTDMRWDVYESSEYQLIIDKSKNLKRQYNYFSSSIE